MPIDLASVLKQIGRNASQKTGQTNTFYYLVDTADIDFRVEGRIGEVSPGVGGLLPDGGEFPTVQYGQKYIVINASLIPDPPFSVLGDTIQNGDIIEKREDGWYIHLDVSATKTNGGALAYSKYDKKFYYYKSTTDGWVELGAGSLTGAAGETWSIQFRSTDGSLSGDAGLLFNNQTNQLVLGPEVVIAFGDGTTQGTARNFYGLTGPTAQRFPIGMSGAGNTGDRLLLATGPSADPFRNYVRFGNGWFQTGVVGIGQGPQGPQGSVGDTGPTGETGAKGETGYGFTAAFISGDGNLYISTLFPSGESGNERSIGFVRGNDGATGSTGFGFTAAFVSGDGFLYISTLFPDGSSGNERSIGFVKGNDGAAGSTGPTGYGFTAAFVSGDGNLYISTLFPSGESGDERSIGFVRGATGATGRFSIGLTVAEQQTYTNRTSTFASGEVGKARKVAFLLEDGSLTFDFVKNVDIFNQSEFQFAALSFSFFDSFDTVQRMRDGTYDLSSGERVFAATYRLGPPVTGSVVSSDGQGPWYYRADDAGSVFRGNVKVSGTGGADRQITFTLQVTGTNGDSTQRYDNTKTLTVRFRNDFLVGMTSASIITGGSTGVNANWLQRDYSSSNPLNEVLSGYTKSVTAAMSENFIYFAYPSRLHSDTSPPQFYLYQVGSAPGFPGGMVLQGYGEAFDEGGLSTMNYTNPDGFVEPYKVWRSDQSYGQNINMVVKVG